MQRFISDDDTVAGAEPVGDKAGEVQLLLDQDEWVFAVLLGFGQLLQNELHIAIGVGVHFVGVVLADGLLGSHLQSLAELMLGQGVSCGAFRSRFSFPIRELLLKAGRGIAVQPAVRGGRRKEGVFTWCHGPTPPHLSRAPRSPWDLRQTTSVRRTSPGGRGPRQSTRRGSFQPGQL